MARILTTLFVLANLFGFCQINKEALSESLRDSTNEIKRLILQKNTVLKELPLTFLKTGKIIQAYCPLPNHPTVLYIGNVSTQSVLLNNSSVDFYTFIQLSELDLSTEDKLKDYCLAYLNYSEHCCSDRFQVIESIDQVPIRKTLNEKEYTRWENIHRNYATKNLEVKSDLKQKEVVCYAIYKYDLVRITVKVVDGYHVEVVENLVEPKLPLVYYL